MFTKFNGKPADTYLREYAEDFIMLGFRYFLKNQQLLGHDAGYITDAAPHSDKFINFMESVDSYFGSKLFTKIEATTEISKIAKAASSPLPSVLLSGKLTITLKL